MLICVLLCSAYLNMTGFARTETQIMAGHENHTLALSRHANDRTTGLLPLASFCDPVNL